MGNLRACSWSVCAVLSCVSSLSAGTLLYWRCDDGPAGSNAGVIANVGGDPALNGTAVSQNGGAVPAFSDEVPAPVIWTGSFRGEVLNSGNASSLRFTNAGLPLLNNNSGGKVFLNDTPALRLGDQTVELFAKIDRHVDWSHVFAKQRAGSDKTWIMEVSNTGVLKLRIDTNPAGQFNQNFGSAVIEDGRWHHLAFTYEQSTRYAKLYVDYALAGQATVAAGLVYTNYPFTLGGGADKPFDGWMDEVRITDRVLAPVDFMTTNAPSQTAEDYVYFTFDGPAGQQSGALPSETYTSFVSAYGGVFSGGLLKPVYSPQVPDPIMLRIRDGAEGQIVSDGNGTALEFVNSGTVSNANDVVASKRGGGVTLVNSTVPFAMTNFTAEVFMKVNRHVDYPIVMSKARAGGFSWSVGLLPNGQLRVRTDTQLPGEPANSSTGYNREYRCGAAGFVEDGKWHHVALSYDAAANQAKLYLDYAVVLDFAPAVHPLQFDGGNYVLGAGDRAFDGLLDEFRLSDKVLGPEQFLRVVLEDGPLIMIN